MLQHTTRRQVLAALAKGAVIAGPAALVTGCAGTSGVDLGATSALPQDKGGEAVAAGGSVQAAKVAMLLPLTSENIQIAMVAKSLQQAAELALFDRNVPGFQLIVRDDKGTAEGAAAAATAAIAEGAELLLGPLMAASVAAVAPIARASKVPVVAFSNEPANGGRGVHLLSFFTGGEVARITGHAIQQNKRHFAALFPMDSFGTDAEPAFQAAVAAGGGSVAILERYPAEISGMMEPARRVFDAIRNSAGSDHPIDALFLPSGTDHVPRLVAMLRHQAHDLGKLQLLLTNGWDSPVALAEPRLTGAWIAAPDPGGWREFSARFGKTYNAAPARLATLAYDAVTVAAAFATQPKGQRYAAADLLRDGGYAGVDGLFRLTAAGPIERSLAVLEIQSHGLVVVGPPNQFGTTMPGQLSQIGTVRG